MKKLIKDSGPELLAGVLGLGIILAFTTISVVKDHETDGQKPEAPIVQSELPEMPELIKMSSEIIYTDDTNDSQAVVHLIGVGEMITNRSKYKAANLNQLLALKKTDSVPAETEIVAKGSYKLSSNDDGKIYPAVFFTTNGDRAFSFCWCRDWPEKTMFAVIEK